MRTLQEEFSQIEIGRSSEFRNLILFPLMRRSEAVEPLDYLLLEDGIAQGKVRVTELPAGGSVPELSLENNSDLPVLLVDGEELVGAKQKPQRVLCHLRISFDVHLVVQREAIEKRVSERKEADTQQHCDLPA